MGSLKNAHHTMPSASSFTVRAMEISRPSGLDHTRSQMVVLSGWIGTFAMPGEG